MLSNKLILEGHDVGMPVKFLAFNEDADFFARLSSEKPARVDVEIVRLRNKHLSWKYSGVRKRGPRSGEFILLAGNVENCDRKGSRDQR